MRLQVRCPRCTYNFPAEGADGSLTLQFDCPSCGYPLKAEGRSPQVASPTHDEPENDLDGWPVCQHCGAPLEQIFDPGGTALSRCSARCMSRPTATLNNSQGDTTNEF